MAGALVVGYDAPGVRAALETALGSPPAPATSS